MIGKDGFVSSAVGEATLMTLEEDRISKPFVAIAYVPEEGRKCSQANVIMARTV